MAEILRLAPNIPTTLIAEDDVCIDRLASLLTTAVIDCEQDADGDLYAHEGLEFPAWISLREDKKLITFLTQISPDLAQRKTIVGEVNSLNRSMMIVQFCWHEDRLWGQYWMTYDGGLDGRHFIKMLRRFSAAFVAGSGLRDEICRRKKSSLAGLRWADVSDIENQSKLAGTLGLGLRCGSRVPNYVERTRKASGTSLSVLTKRSCRCPY